MTTRNWVACVLLALLAFGASFALGLDAHHTVAITAAAFMVGAANVLLEALSADPASAEPELVRVPRGLEDEQALAFSLSVNGGRSGNRARAQLMRLASRFLDADESSPATASLRPTSAFPDPPPALAVVLDRNLQETDFSRTTMQAAIGELEQLILTESADQTRTEPTRTEPESR